MSLQQLIALAAKARHMAAHRDLSSVADFDCAQADPNAMSQADRRDLYVAQKALRVFYGQIQLVSRRIDPLTLQACITVVQGEHRIVVWGPQGLAAVYAAQADSGLSLLAAGPISSQAVLRACGWQTPT